MLGDWVECWFGVGWGVNKSGGEALVGYKPADNISGSGDPSAKPNSCTAPLNVPHTYLWFSVNLALLALTERSAERGRTCL